jgi:alpha-glucosidase
MMILQMGNHDYSRIASRYPGRADQMIMLQMILPGVAITYNGEEIGMVDKQNTHCKNMQFHKAELQACNEQKKYYDRLYSPNHTPFQWDSTQNAG